ncbi:MAG: hypothetical protein JOZ17_19585, partial [Acetobacteraceae bacterium]|nr:hypothetical protein [Acetobacteraceae bacterium]
EALAHAPMGLDWRRAGQVRHGLTHFELVIDLFAARSTRIEAKGFLRPVAALDQEALPSLMRKCVRMLSRQPEGSASATRAGQVGYQSQRVHDQAGSFHDQAGS